MTAPRFFASSADFHAWLAKHHDKEPQIVVGFTKKGAPKQGLGYKQAVDEALAFGWIDGHTRGIDETSWCVRFTPRKPKSHWSAVNVKRVGELKKQGRMQPSGLAAFERRTKAKAPYSYENRKAIELPPAYQRALRANAAAAEFFAAQPPSYVHVAKFWVMSAKKEETRERRLQALLESSAKGERLKQFVSPSRRKKTGA